MGAKSITIHPYFARKTSFILLTIKVVQFYSGLKCTLSKYKKLFCKNSQTLYEHMELINDFIEIFLTLCLAIYVHPECIWFTQLDAQEQNYWLGLRLMGNILCHDTSVQAHKQLIFSSCRNQLYFMCPLKGLLTDSHDFQTQLWTIGRLDI